MIYEGSGHLMKEEAQRFATRRSSDREHKLIAQHVKTCLDCAVLVEISSVSPDPHPDLDLSLDVDE